MIFAHRPLTPPTRRRGDPPRFIWWPDPLGGVISNAIPFVSPRQYGVIHSHSDAISRMSRLNAYNRADPSLNAAPDSTVTLRRDKETLCPEICFVSE